MEKGGRLKTVLATCKYWRRSQRYYYKLVQLVVSVKVIIVH